MDQATLPADTQEDTLPAIQNNFAGNVQTAGDFVAGNKITHGDDIQGDKIAGDKVLGDKIINVYVTTGGVPDATASPLLNATIECQPFEPETVLIPGGRFVMGSTSFAEETPQRELELPVFRMGKTAITNRHYAEFLKANPAQPEPDRQLWFLRKPKQELLDHPVVNVSWHDARAYCAWLSKQSGRSYQLPSEAEWEKAARGSDGRLYPWGNCWQDGYANVGSATTSAVTAFAIGASPYGCLDMLGNVQEWTETPDSQDIPPLAYIVRSGSFRSQPVELRCTYRASVHPDSKVNWRGFRVLLKIE